MQQASLRSTLSVTAALHNTLRFSTLMAVALGLAACGDSPNQTADGGIGSKPKLENIPFAADLETDPFYAQPSDWQNKQPGDILQHREISFAAVEDIPLPPFRAWQLQYVTTDIDGSLMANVTTIVKPLLPGPTGTSPVVSYQYAYNSLGAACTPSRVLSGTGSNPDTEVEFASYALQILSAGWTMVIPDHEGPYHAYGVGRIAAHTGLDSLRAAIAFEPADINDTDPIGLWGYSAGGLATLSIASVQPQYAPELNIQAVAAGGAAADMVGIAEAAQNTVNFPLIFSLLMGINRAFPELLADGVFNQAGLEQAEAMRNGCAGNTSDGSAQPSGYFHDYMTENNVFQSERYQRVREQVKLPFAGHVPTAEVYMYHEIDDELVPIDPADHIVETWCAQGVKLSYSRNSGGDHLQGAFKGAPDAGLFLASRLAAAPVEWNALNAVSCN